MHQAHAADTATGLFVVAANARLARVTQGKRSFTLWIRIPGAESACGMMGQKVRETQKMFQFMEHSATHKFHTYQFSQGIT
jgi:hypothetical protein